MFAASDDELNLRYFKIMYGMDCWNSSCMSTGRTTAVAASSDCCPEIEYCPGLAVALQP